jgi:hypothetical protein
VRAATGRDKNSGLNEKILTSIVRENSFECLEWLSSSASLQTIEIVLLSFYYIYNVKNLLER